MCQQINVGVADSSRIDCLLFILNELWENNVRRSSSGV